GGNPVENPFTDPTRHSELKLRWGTFFFWETCCRSHVHAATTLVLESCSTVAAGPYYPTMAPTSSRQPTTTTWSVEYETARRQRLLRNPPRDHTAYPSLAAAIEPHVHSFNAVFEQGGLLEKAIQDIGTKVFLDGDSYSTSQDTPRNRLSVRIKEAF